MNKTDCYPDEVIKKKLTASYLNVFYTDYNVTLRDYDQPLKLIMKNELNDFSSSIFKNYYKTISEIKVRTDSNILTSSYTEERGYIFSDSKESVDFREHNYIPDAIAEVTFNTSGKSQIYYRNYIKLFEILARIGGFSNGLIIFTQLLLHTYSNNIILWHCIFNVMSNEDIKQNIENYSFKIKNDKEREFIKTEKVLINQEDKNDKVKEKRRSTKDKSIIENIRLNKSYAPNFNNSNIENLNLNERRIKSKSIVEK